MVRLHSRYFQFPGEDSSLGTRALESCAYLAQSMLAHNFRNGPPMSSTEMEMFGSSGMAPEAFGAQAVEPDSTQQVYSPAVAAPAGTPIGLPETQPQEKQQQQQPSRVPAQTPPVTPVKSDPAASAGYNSQHHYYNDGGSQYSGQYSQMHGNWPNNGGVYHGQYEHASQQQQYGYQMSQMHQYQHHEQQHHYSHHQHYVGPVKQTLL